MDTAQTLLGLIREDIDTNASNTPGSIYFYSPRPNVASPGFQTLQRDTNFNWLSQGRLSRENAMQFTGGGEDTVVLEGKLFPHLFGGLKTLDRLREAGYAGNRFLLQRYYVVNQLNQAGGNTGSFEYVGELLGRFGIRRVRRGEVRIGNTGLPDVMEFSLELIKLGDDAGDGTTNEFLFWARSDIQAEREGAS